jgi:hypothetical protein
LALEKSVLGSLRHGGPGVRLPASGLKSYGFAEA